MQNVNKANQPRRTWFYFPTARGWIVTVGVVVVVVGVVAAFYFLSLPA